MCSDEKKDAALNLGSSHQAHNSKRGSGGRH